MDNGEILVIGDDLPDANCFTLPDGSCVAPDPCMHSPKEHTTNGPLMTGSDNVEYDIMMPGGGVETVKAGGLEGIMDAYLLAKRRRMQLRMVKILLKRQKRRIKLQESKKTRVSTARKKNKLAKASRKKNRHQ